MQVSDVQALELLAGSRAMDYVLKVIRGITTRDVYHDLGPTRMLVQERRDVIHLSKT